MKNRSFSNLLASCLLLAATTLGLTSCAAKIYYYPEYNYAGRPTPPSGLLQRVLAAYTANGSSGGLEILDGYRDLRGNVQNTIKSYFIKGYSEAQPITILNFPEETLGYVLSYTDGALTNINYSTEASSGAIASYGADTPSAAAAPNGAIFAGAEQQSGILSMSTGGTTYNLYLPNVDKVVIDPGYSTVLAMVHNSNALYRIVRLPATDQPVTPPGAVDCEPLLLPVYCVVPVGGNSNTYDRPTNVSYSLDGSVAYVLNSGPEYGGTTASVAFLQMSALNINNLCVYGYPSAACPAPASPLTPISVANPIPVPGGVTAALSDGTTLYLAGQQLNGNGLFGGNLSLLNLSTFKVGTPIPISDGIHTKLLFADNNTLWIAATACANGVRAALANAGNQTQSANYNCLTRYVPNSTVAGGTNAVLPSWAAKTAYNVGSEVCDGPIVNNAAGCSTGDIEVAQTAGTSGTATPNWSTALNGTTADGGVVWVNIGALTAAQIVPAITPNNTSSTALTVGYPNTNQNLVYYGSLTGLCWVQGFYKVYTADGGQIHAFNTIDGSEINNYNITIQGTVYDVAYMDALTNSAD